MGDDRREAEVPGRLLRGVIPGFAALLALEGGHQREGLAAVGALEEPGGLGAHQQAAVCRHDVRDLRELQLVAVGVAEPFARVLPGLAKVCAAPDRRAEPLARGGCVDRSRVAVERRVVDRPALAVRTAHAPVAAIVALQDEQALAGSDQQQALRHLAHLRLDGLSVVDRSRREKSSVYRSSSPGRASR